MIYKPREDSFLLEKYVKKFAYGKILDMGTGSGIQALAAKTKTQDILAVDSNMEAVAHVKKLGIKALQSDLFSNVKGTFDVIICNPPYLPAAEGEDSESRQSTTGGKYGYEFIERFLKEAQQYLKKEGIILLVYSSLSGGIGSIAKKLGYKIEILEEQKVFFEILKVAKISVS